MAQDGSSGSDGSVAHDGAEAHGEAGAQVGVEANGGAETEPHGALRVERLGAPPPDWDDLIARSSLANFCHLAGWREVMEETLGHEYVALAAREPGGELVAGLPLVAVRSRLFGSYLVSMPFLNYGGPIGSPEGCRALIDDAASLARERGVDLLELRARESFEQPHPVNERKVTVLLDLPDDPDVLFKDQFRSKLRSQIRRPMKEGMEVRFGHDQIGPFYRIFAENMRDLGTPVLPRALFDRIARVFGEVAVFGVVYAGDEPVAGGAGFQWGDEFELTWASSLRAWNRQAPNMLLYWGLMERAIEEGVGVFNFGRCTPGGGTHRFKAQWGGEDQVLPWIQVTPSGEPAATPNPDQGKYKVATQVWSKLPLGVTKAVGPWLARRIP